MKKKILLGLLATTAIMALGACGTSGQTAKKDGKLQIVTTFYPMKEFTDQIVGDQANVSVLVKPGIEPHDFEPSAKDVAAIQDSDAFVYNNENMETWVKKTTKDMKKVDVIKASEGILLLPGVSEEESGHDHSDGHTHVLDPHVWLAPSLAIKEVETIRDQLIKKFPNKKTIFTKNATAYLTKLKGLDQAYKDGLANAKQKNFVTQHAAFAYLSLEYGLNQISVSGINPETEPSASRLKDLKAYVEKNDIEYIYFEGNASDKVAKTLADEAGVKTLALNPLESLTQDQEKAGEDYISVMTENLKNLQKTTNAESKVTAIEPEKPAEKTTAQGYFKDNQVKDRKLSDWSGNWQSVYPLLQKGELDQVMRYKSLMNKDMTEAAYKAYYMTGYKSDVEKIDIKNDKVTFMINGKANQATYKYAGKEVLTYKKGNRGVRYLFEAVGETNGAYKYIQFSDHGISPAKADHFHIYYGNDSQKMLTEELTNWPTYYPSDMSATAIAQEMIAH
ncbi:MULTISPECIES: zinc ABC transporter substrate-binding protein AdcA [Pseudolactococcus]|uniref:Zinc-binding protein AdcA n=1 Tax=Pseudolactococcus piscium MKFS47 TaxID=297352 RepID=A0A0D6DWJ7_9LACT|nr:zinc ABC transporter substrate-binding protein AdcA [Lactococcus carnosus]MCJ2000658.1 zinc ABC transporter substrate-binding protein AdcA [Lactococcus carnosus]CEN28355.1 Zinc-binding protein AdcA precursor [Lactococcus piscium MKFS47]